MTPPTDDRFEREDRLIDRAAHAVRAQELPDEAVAAAARRVGGALRHADAVHDCASFRAMFEEALAGTLAEGRSLLLDAHTRECVTCRHALRDAREGVVAGPAVARRAAPAARSRRPALRWLAAAAVLAAVAAGAYLIDSSGLGGGSPFVTVGVVDGRLFEVKGASLLPVNAKEISYGRTLRTAPRSNALLELPDGTRIELDERTELSFAARGRDTEIRLARGNVIVQAAKQKSGHLFVTTADFEIAVVGTVFAVDAGTRGSRVSVLEGEVHVERASQETVLRPGGQFLSSAALGPAPLAEQVAWSRNREAHLALIAELSTINAEIAALPGPAARTSTRLLELLPADVVMYAAIPNVSDTLQDAQRVFVDHLRTSAGLREWWEASAGPEGTRRLEATVAKIQRFGRLLGDEIVFAVAHDQARGDEGHAVVILAEVRDGAALRAAVESELQNKGELRFLDALPAPRGPAGQHELLAYVDGPLLVASNHGAVLEGVVARRAGGEAGLAGTPLGTRLAQSYADGVVWLAGADLRRILESAKAAHGGEPASKDAFEKLGFAQARFLVLEARGDGAHAVRRASLEFDGERSGVASWLAEPAPMGALTFVSPDAQLVAAAVLKDPASMFDDLLGAVQSDADARAQFKASLGMDLRDDVLAALGGEMALALDGPVLPVPAVKLVLEVYDAGRLQHALDTIVARVNSGAPAERRMELVREEIGGRSWWTVRHASGSDLLVYTFEDGYIVMAPQRGIIERSLANRRAGVTLLGSPGFRALMPQDRSANVSALGYRAGGAAMESLGDALGGIFGALPVAPPAGDEAPRLGLDALVASGGPALVYASGESDRISIGTSGGQNGVVGLLMLLGLAEANAALEPQLGAALAPGGGPDA